MNAPASAAIDSGGAFLHKKWESEAIGHNPFIKHFLIKQQRLKGMVLIPTAVSTGVGSYHYVIDIEIWVLNEPENISGIAERTRTGNGAKIK
ncbi:hypothetical protein TorRG33x02_286410 [Trema orientale]|uniref:Uncharacterized protein n=1 Tax=Trema orientale TaxID=63057 RepID=A0A2P5CG54_TREOI|nr:hypothetical protein TorRG33x02_286410 [Trema orientale]